MRKPVRSRLEFTGVIAAILIPAILLAPTYSLAQEAMVGAKMSIDSSGKVEVNNMTVYRPDEAVLYADSGQVATDAIMVEQEEAWYEPTVGKFLIGLVFIGACVGIAFIVDNNVDTKYEWYYDEDCDCWKRREK